ncbi:type IV pilus biogenesis protein PilM [Clostridium sp. LP20]|uniref:type IV pilus biogenesis protein PilM n=1 Tax=Clostridium sp. LP20 TaxID=3418665 RepID=UPI003EE665C9
MFEKDLVGIDINSNKITMLIGNKYKVQFGRIIDTPKGTFENDKITDVKGIAEVLHPILKKEKCRAKDAAFVVRGQDLIVRHMALPMAKDEVVMRDSVNFELRQFIGDRIEDYYFDYEVIHYDKNDASGNAQILIVACEKKKVEDYIELGKLLGLNVKTIDIYANTIARVIRNLKQSVTKGIRYIGVMEIEKNSTSMSIVDWGKLSMEKYQGYGVANASETVLDNSIQYGSFLESINLVDVGAADEKVERLFKDVTSQYNSLIQYFTAGKIRKNLDRVYLVGSGTKIRGIDQYLSVNMNNRIGSTLAFTDLKNSVKCPKKVCLKDYIFPYGLLLRRE